MVKKKNAQKKKTMRVPRAVQSRLDANAMAYARLLSDPCSGPLVNPTYAGGDGGYVTRYELDFTLDSVYANAQTNGAILFAPGLIGTSATDTASISGNNSFMALNTSTAGANQSETAIYTWYTRGADATQPGKSAFAFLTSNVRAVAACLQVYYVGTELNRRGTLSLGKVNAGSILGNDSASVAGLRQVCTDVFRTPDSMVEFKWTPSDGDQLYTDPSLISLQRESERKSAILLTFSGIPREDIRVRMVAVYEWQPNASQGLVNPSQNRNRTNNSLDHVLNYLDSLGPWWKAGMKIYDTYKKVMAPSVFPPPMRVGF